jgi:hypothetical protein
MFDIIALDERAIRETRLKREVDAKELFFNGIGSNDEIKADVQKP